MSAEWLTRFLNFTKTIDYVDDEIFENVKDLLEDYLRDTLRICYFRVSQDGLSLTSDEGDVPALSPIWSSHKNRLGDLEIFTSDGKCNGLEAYAYHKRKTLWITAVDGGRLLNATDLVDEWFGATNFPSYSDYGGGRSKTCILHPLEYGGRLFGIINLEFEERLAISGRAKRSARALANGVSRLIWLHQTNNAQRDDSREAFGDLLKSFHSPHSPLTRRTVFLANSNWADERVINVVKRTLAEFEDLFDVDHWVEETSSGTISEHVRTAILAAEFGVCYMSEPQPNPKQTRTLYQDNPNVLFEAGMFQMVHEMRDAPGDPNAARWIPIREATELSTPVPFDFSGDRILTVPRIGENLDVDEEELAQQIRNTVRRLVQSLKID
jgi:hypothetical protein